MLKGVNVVLKSNQTGFTITELVMVTVVAGILVTAMVNFSMEILTSTLSFKPMA